MCNNTFKCLKLKIMKVEWFKVSEKPPSVDDIVLMWNADRLYGNSAVGFYENGKWYLFHTDTSEDPVTPPTHWCYLPDSPYEE